MNSSEPRYTIKVRARMEVNTDPQRRCYDGCHAKSEMRWTLWMPLDINIPDDKVEGRLKFWQELNEYAVSQRGESALREFEASQQTNPLTFSRLVI